MEDDLKATTGQKIECRSRINDPNWLKANALLSQMEKLKAQRAEFLRQAAAYKERIDQMESEFYKLILELEPTVVGGPNSHGSKKTDKEELSKLQKALSSKIADNPSLETQLRKILGLD